MKQRVGLLGLGIMGTAMAANVVRAGYPLQVYNRTPGKAGELAALGVTEAVSYGLVSRPPEWFLPMRPFRELKSQPWTAER